MKKYGVLSDLIRKEFGTLSVFSRESGIPKATLSLLIGGKYGSNEAKMIKRITAELKRLRPDLDLSRIWDVSYAWHEKYLLEKALVKNGFRIIVDCKLAESGEMAISPTVEGY